MKCDMRLTADEYFMKVAVVVASRATCPRRQVGAVVVRDGNILSTGYNGAVRGATHCIESGCLLEHEHCVRAVHAEANALIQAARHGVCTDRADMYSTTQPCRQCAKLIVNAGITKVVYGSYYGEEQGLELLRSAGVKVVYLRP